MVWAELRGCSDGFDEDKGQVEGDEGAIVLGHLLTAQGDAFEALLPVRFCLPVLLEILIMRRHSLPEIRSPRCNQHPSSYAQTSTPFCMTDLLVISLIFSQ